MKSIKSAPREESFLYLKIGLKSGPDSPLHAWGIQNIALDKVGLGKTFRVLALYLRKNS